MRPKFVCEITGNSCFTYFQALESEKNEMQKVENNFPEPLKEPVLRALQFLTIPRLDLLVDMVYSQFRLDFYPGESVLVRIQDTKKYAKIKEKARFNPCVDEYGMIRPGFCSYRVLFDDNTEVTIDETTISRDRLHFTKWIVKTFIKLSVARLSRIGAPWIVRDQYASRYKIPTEYPPHLLSFAPESQNPEKTDKLKALTPKNRKRRKDFKKLPLSDLIEGDKRRKVQEDEPVFQSHHNAYSGPPPPPALVAAVGGVQRNANLVNQGSYLETVAPKKSIVEDLKIPFGLYATVDPNSSAAKEYRYFKKPEAKIEWDLRGCVSEALQSWIFLNVYHSALVLEPFTFDAFVKAFRTGEGILVDEVFCALLSCFLMGEGEDINVKIKGFELEMNDFNVENEKDEDEDEVEEHNFPVPTAKSCTKDEYLLVTVPQVASYLSDDEDDESPEEVDPAVFEKQKERELKKEEGEKQERASYGLKYDIYDKLPPTPESDEDVYDGERNNAVRYFTYRGTSWQERLYHRNFKDGGWQIVLLGVLSLISHLKKYKVLVAKVNDILAPKGVNPLGQAIRTRFYEQLSTELKFKTLSAICEVLADGRVIRAYIDNAMHQATLLRRDRLEAVREYKGVTEKARDLQAEMAGLLDAWRKSKGKPELPEVHEDGRRRRRLNLTRTEPTTDEQNFGEENAEFKKKLDMRLDLLTRAEVHRQTRRKIERKLVELECGRVKVLGKDSLYNKYWWFEANGLPLVNKVGATEEEEEGHPEEDDQPGEEDARYLMGRLWVQGCSLEDSESILGVVAKDIEKFQKIREVIENEEGLESSERVAFEIAAKEAFGVNIESTLQKPELLPIERKLLEEAPRPLLSASDWKYYDSNKQIEQLIRLLNPWGKRESDLRKLLVSFNKAIELSVGAREKSRDDGDEWVNTCAIERLGHGHYEGPKARAKPKKKSK